MSEKQVQVEALLSLLSAPEVTEYIDAGVLAEIKQYDDAPVFAMMTIGCEGESTGALHNGPNLDRVPEHMEYKQLWPLKAIKELVTQLKQKAIPIFTNVHDVEGKLNRRPVGRLVAATKKVIKNATHAMGVAYITDMPTRSKLKTGDLNACSMEAKCIFSKAERAVSWIVQKVTDVMGVVLFNGNIVQPGFKDASIHAVVTAMAVEDEKGQEDMEITRQDVKQYIEKHSLLPTDLFSVQTLTSEPKVKDCIDNEVGVAVKAKDAEITELKAELAPLKSKLAEGQVTDLIGSSELLKDEAIPLVDYLKKVLVVEGTVDQAAVDAKVKAQLAIIKSSGITFGEKKADDDNKDKDKDKDKDKSADDTDTGDKVAEDYTKAENNQLIPTLKKIG
jgi:hypothetical protein